MNVVHQVITICFLNKKAGLQAIHPFLIGSARSLHRQQIWVG
jgi:hypothetical protein